jgi:hypothetical protein
MLLRPPALLLALALCAQGDGWTVFLPAMTALQQEIVDCVDDADTQFRRLRLSPAPSPAVPERCEADCAQTPSAAL